MFLQFHSITVRVRNFNVLQPPPDVQKEEWNACSAPEAFAQGEIGYRQLGDRVYDFLEKQVINAPCKCKMFCDFYDLFL